MSLSYDSSVGNYACDFDCSLGCGAVKEMLVTLQCSFEAERRRLDELKCGLFLIVADDFQHSNFIINGTLLDAAHITFE